MGASPDAIQHRLIRCIIAGTESNGQMTGERAVAPVRPTCRLQTLVQILLERDVKAVRLYEYGGPENLKYEEDVPLFGSLAPAHQAPLSAAACAPLLAGR